MQPKLLLSRLSWISDNDFVIVSAETVVSGSELGWVTNASNLINNRGFKFSVLTKS